MQTAIAPELVEQIAQVAHEANRAYCATLGDTSQPSWADAPDWQKDSARKGVRFHLTHSAGPEESHKSWLEQKKAEGWIYGPVKDPAKKEHPCMVPYEQLPLEQRMKDFIFTNIVLAFAAAHGV